MHVATNVSLYRNIFVCLVMLTGLTIGIAFVDLGPMNVFVALTVASTLRMSTPFSTGKWVLRLST